MQRGERGFTLLETVIGLAVMTIMVTAVSGLFVSNLQTLALGKARAIGLALANEQMEYLRDLPYDNVKTVNGAIYPPGTLLDTQTLARGGYTFTVKTQVDYVDNPFDGNAAGTIVGKPQDLNPADFKKAQISVYLKSNNKLVAQVTSDIAGKAAETASNTGVLSIRVLDASGAPIANASVTITNANPSPAVNISTNTDNQGYVVVPNLPPDASNRYQVTATLAGYSTDTTIPDPAGAQTAVELNPNVLVQQVTNVTLAVDRLSTLSLHVTDTTGAVLASKAITVSGAKQIKQTPTVYKYSTVSTTDASGNISLTNMEWDSYSFTPPAGYYVVSSQPYSPVALSPNGAASVNLVLSNSSTYPTVSAINPVSGQTGTASLTLTITGTNLLSSATVKLKQAGQTDITATGVSSANGNTKLSATFNLTGAATGLWDLVITTASGTVTQIGGFSVTP